jgi:osmoprotectant transport system permease protein
MKYLLNPSNYDWSDPGSIPNLILKHFYLVGITMLIALIIAIPLGILVARYRQLYLLVITIAGLLYTIPGVAFIGILITITHLSPATVLIPLILYTQLVLIRNTAAGINGVDPHLLEVGSAMGMTPLQSLVRITFPLALPTVVAGIRIATVTTIGEASLASLAGQSGLGDLIFQNIEGLNFDAIYAGGILMGLFAILADLLLLGLQMLLNRGRGSLSIAK